MTIILTRANYITHRPLLDEMHRIRKRVFVDLLRWDVPVRGGELEIDQFDHSGAVYLVNLDGETGEHRGSVRLLPSTMPHILGDLFPHLCAKGVPVGPAIYEVTRAVTNPRFRAAERLRIRNELTSALVDYALLTGISAYTAVAEQGWYSQMLALGWHATPLGLPQLIDGKSTSALRISINTATIAGLKAAGNYAPTALFYPNQRIAA